LVGFEMVIAIPAFVGEVDYLSSTAGLDLLENENCRLCSYVDSILL
jgi:hypothetical protein